MEPPGVSSGTMQQLLEVDADEIRGQLPQIQQHLAKFGDRIPAKLREQLGLLAGRVSGAG